jgi:hypothetical protein
MTHKLVYSINIEMQRFDSAYSVAGTAALSMLTACGKLSERSMREQCICDQQQH